MNTILIIALIALIITVVINIKKVRTLNQEKIELTSSNYERKNRIYTFEKEVETKNSTIRRQRTEMANLQNRVAVDDKKLNTKIVLVTSPNGNEIVTNAKIKTIVGSDGKTTMYPTIRRKVKGAWKEVPVYMKTIIDK